MGPLPENQSREKKGTVKRIPRDAAVGPFWFVQTRRGIRLIAQPCPLADAERYGDCLTSPDGHYDLWEGWRTGQPPDDLIGVVHETEYEEHARGRVVLDTIRDRFMIYADRQILEKPELRQCILERFGIPAKQADWNSDSHYQRSRRL